MKRLDQSWPFRMQSFCSSSWPRGLVTVCPSHHEARRAGGGSWDQQPFLVQLFPLASVLRHRIQHRLQFDIDLHQGLKQDNRKVGEKGTGVTNMIFQLSRWEWKPAVRNESDDYLVTTSYLQEVHMHWVPLFHTNRADAENEKIRQVAVYYSWASAN